MNQTANLKKCYFVASFEIVIIIIHFEILLAGSGNVGQIQHLPHCCIVLDCLGVAAWVRTACYVSFGLSVVIDRRSLY